MNAKSSLFTDAAQEAREAAKAFPKLARMLNSFAEKLDRAEKLVAAAVEVNDELGTGEWTERSRARLNNALLDVRGRRG